MLGTASTPRNSRPHHASALLTYRSLSTNPKLKFLIIINPNSGPGAAPWWPNEDYVREIPRLNAFANVTIVGYVRATYCERPLSEVFEDIDAYATRFREDKSGGLGVQGIFLDETVNLYSKKAKQYLDEIDLKVKTTDGITVDRLVSISLCVVTRPLH